MTAMQAVLSRSQAKGLDRAVAAAVAYYANHETGLAFPSNERLIADWGFSERRIQIALRALERSGDLHRRPDLETFERRRVYVVSPAQLSILPDETGAPAAGAWLHAGAPSRERVEGTEKTVNTTPQPPRGSTKDFQQSGPPSLTGAVERAAGARRRRRRRRPDEQGSVASEPCPLRTPQTESLDLGEEWAGLEERLRSELGQRWELWFTDAHPHRSADGLLVVGIHPDRTYASGRFRPLLQRFGVTLVGCEAMT